MCNLNVKSDLQKRHIVEFYPQNNPHTDVAGVKRKRVGGRRGSGNPNIHTGKSVSLSLPDKNPLDKCGQAGEEPSFTSDRVQDSDKDEDPLGKMWE